MFGEKPETFGQRLYGSVNRLGYGLRQFLRRGGGQYTEPYEDKAALFSGRENSRWLQGEAERLRRRYNLEHLWRHSGRSRYLENLNVLQTLESLLADEALPETGDEPLSWLDVGAKNWSYAEALYRLLKSNRNPVSLYGLEVDAYRRYVDRHNRLEYAEAFTRHLPDARFVPGDVLAWNRPVHGASMFLPFVFREPCLAWGLPGEFFQPGAILRHVVGLLKPGGVLLITNQDEDETTEQRRMLAPWVEAGILSVAQRDRMPDSFLEYRYPRYGWFCRKTGSHTG